MQLLIAGLVELIGIFWAISYTTQIKLSIKRILFYILLSMGPAIVLLQFVGQWQGIIYLIISSFTYFYWLSKSFLTLIHICFVLIFGVITDNLSQYVMTALPNILPGNLEHLCIFTLLFVVSIIIYQHSTRKIYNLIGEIKVAYMLILFIALVTMGTFYINLYLTDYLSKQNLLKFNIITQITYFAIMLFVLYFTIVTIKKKTTIEKLSLKQRSIQNTCIHWS